MGFTLAAAASASIWSDNRGVVERVVDGDTLIASVAGEPITIRLLNIDTPETKHPDLPVQCLGDEATEWLAMRLPQGSKIAIEYDKQRTDHYGRTLAGVFEDGALVNAEIAGQGLGVPAYYAPNDRFLSDVEAAYEEAKKAGVGLFDPSLKCTLSGQVSHASTTAASVATAYEEGMSLEGEASKVAAVAATAALLRNGALDRLGNAILSADAALIAAAERSLDSAHELARTSYERLTQSEAEYRAAKEAAERAEAERIERERIAREQREAAERAEKERIEREAREAAERAEQERREAREREARAERERLQQAERERARARERDVQVTPKKTATKSRKCVPYGPEIPYSKAGGYTGKRYGMPGGKTFRKCS
ncbi:thermonuclease family protein [Tessaracoccus oleiagri]|uniref:thermonuclease family protein n=1 Tax=Tessaracoccus oleiagri TaxID=686624 RepID=UPI0015A3CE6A|nr:thermonuclease family protein [Tessaracoccus oleiagri]